MNEEMENLINKVEIAGYWEEETERQLCPLSLWPWTLLNEMTNRLICLSNAIIDEIIWDCN